MYSNARCALLLLSFVACVRVRTGIILPYTAGSVYSDVSGTVSVTIPDKPLTIPGDYLLFIVNEAGVPSLGKYVNVLDNNVTSFLEPSTVDWQLLLAAQSGSGSSNDHATIIIAVLGAVIGLLVILLFAIMVYCWSKRQVRHACSESRRLCINDCLLLLTLALLLFLLFSCVIDETMHAGCCAVVIKKLDKQVSAQSFIPTTVECCMCVCVRSLCC